MLPLMLYSRLYAHEGLFRKLQFTRLFAVRVSIIAYASAYATEHFLAAG